MLEYQNNMYKNIEVLPHRALRRLKLQMAILSTSEILFGSLARLGVSHHHSLETK